MILIFNYFTSTSPRRLVLVFAAAFVAMAIYAARRPAAVGAASTPEPSRTFLVMGAPLVVTLTDPGSADRRAVTDTLVAAAHGVDDYLSTWRPGSDLDRINHAPIGQWVPVAPFTAALLREVVDWSRLTNGAFDPGVGRLIDAWDLRGDGRRPRDEEVREARLRSGLHHFTIDDDAARVRRTADAWLDAGGFGKGAALRAAAEVLLASPVRSATLDFGGQFLLHGPGPAGGRWPVGVAHPGTRDQVAVRLLLEAGSVATSGQSERGIEVDGEHFGHVLDPRTGRPVPAWGSVTVVDPDPGRADALATGLLAMGPTAARTWAERHPDTAVLVLADEDGRLGCYANLAMRPLLDPSFPEDCTV